jgi:hypothetical protein
LPQRSGDEAFGLSASGTFRTACLRNGMTMTVLVVVAFVTLVILLFAADRANKAVVSGRRRRAMGERLVAAQAKAEEDMEQRRRKAQTGEALTSVIPGIHPNKPRDVSEPSLASSQVSPGERRAA